MLQNLENMFAGMSAWGANLPLYFSVPLVMVLATVGTVAIVALLLGLIRLIFGKKAIDFIKSMPERVDATTKNLSGNLGGKGGQRE